MRIFDINNDILESFDLSVGRLELDKIFVAHHPAIDRVEDVWHYEVVHEYPNGGKDLAVIIDVPGADAVEAWDEYEDILRYIPYTQEELEKREANQRSGLAYRVTELEEALELLLSGETK